MKTKARKDFDEQAYLRQLISKTPTPLDGLEGRAADKLRALVVKLSQMTAQLNGLEKEIERMRLAHSQGQGEIRRLEGEFEAMKVLLCDAEADRQGFTESEPNGPKEP